MDIYSQINWLIVFFSNHQTLTYLILFLGSFFETVIGFSFFVYGEVFFLVGSILAGMGVLNIWMVVLTLYIGGIGGDSLSYFLGRNYGLNLYYFFENIIFFKKYINKENYQKGTNFFKKYGGYSVFFARFLGPISWITPFLAGIYKLDYKVFLEYDLPAIILGIGQFIIIGYFAGIHYKIILNLFFKYIFILLFITLVLFFLYIYLKRKKYISKFKKRWAHNKKRLFIITIKHFTLITITTIIIFLIFLLYLSFGYKALHPSNIKSNKTILLNNTYINNCKNLDTYYLNSYSDIIQPINIIFITNKDISSILGTNWFKVGIFREKQFSIKDFITSIKNKTLPVSNLYMNNLSQDTAYQYKKNSIIKREHIRFWNFTNKNNSKQKIYLGSISDDDGITFKFYNHFFTPVHEIDQNVDKSRNFIGNYLSNKKGLKCTYIQTNCGVKKNKSDEQQYYTDGKILSCSTN